MLFMSILVLYNVVSVHRAATMHALIQSMVQARANLTSKTEIPNQDEFWWMRALLNLAPELYKKF